MEKNIERPWVLSVQSFVVHGYVGNKCSTFALQTLGIDVDPLCTVLFSNHTAKEEEEEEEEENNEEETFIYFQKKKNQVHEAKLIIFRYRLSIYLMPYISFFNDFRHPRDQQGLMKYQVQE